MLISQKPVQRSEIGEKSSFSLITGSQQRVKESYQFVSNWPLSSYKNKFVMWKRNHFQCLVNVNVNFLIYMIEISVEYTKKVKFAKWRSL